MVKERMSSGGWEVEGDMMTVPRIILENLAGLERESRPRQLPYVRVTPAFYTNTSTTTELTVLEEPLSFAVRAKFCSYQLCCRPFYENQPGYLMEKEMLESV